MEGDMESTWQEYMDDWENLETVLEDGIKLQKQLLKMQQQFQPIKHGGSLPGKRPNKLRDYSDGYRRIVNDYFCDTPVYDREDFRRRFRMSKRLFLKVVKDMEDADSYFKHKRDATSKLGISSIQKCMAAIKILAYGFASDACDEYVRVADSTAMETLKRFVQGIRQIYESKYLRQPTRADLQKHIVDNETKRRWPGMFGSLDCMHYEWKNCPTTWAGQFLDKDHLKTIILECICTQDLWIWHAYFGMSGTNNDINVLDSSHVLHNYLEEETSDLSFVVNGNSYPGYYLLTDSIYPTWGIFVQTYHHPETKKKKHFAKLQEAATKGVERCYGVLQIKWGILHQASRQWNLATIKDIVIACIILHNMIIENENEDELPSIVVNQDENIVPREQRKLTFQEFREGSKKVKDSRDFFKVRNDLVEHHWARRGSMQL